MYVQKKLSKPHKVWGNARMCLPCNVDSYDDSLSLSNTEINLETLFIAQSRMCP